MADTVSKEKMISIEKDILDYPDLSSFTKKAIVLMLRKSQLLTEPVDLSLHSSPKSKDITRFISSWVNSDGCSINKLLENISSLMLFSTKSSGDRTIISLHSENQPDLLYLIDVDNFQP